MTSQDSDPDLTARLAASLTAPVVRALPMRGEQSSGLFNLDALYARQAPAVYLVPASTRPPALPAPTRPMPASTWAPPVPMATRPMAARDAVWLDARHLNPALVRARRPIGWFAVFVAWLATATLGMLSATQIPGHAVARASTPSPVAPVASTEAPVTPSAVAQTSPPASPQLVEATSLPSVPAPASAAAPVAPVVPVAVAAPPPAVAPPHRVIALGDAPSRPAAARTAAPSPPPKHPVAQVASPPSTAGLSLEALMRREVAAEQKRSQAAAKP